MNILNQANKLTGSYTGNINKALLFVKKKNTESTRTNIQLRQELTEFAITESLLSSPRKSLEAASRLAKSDDINSDYHVLQVKYNPSSIQMATQAGTYRHCGVGAMGINQFTEIVRPAETNMTVELVFDDMNIPDAFMWDRFEASVGNAISATAGVVKQIRKDGYSVQNQIDGLVGLITQALSRRVVFCWSKMAYAGEVTNVQAKYTMFNPQGHPVRGVVTLTIYQNDEQKYNSDTEYWNRAFENLFGDYSKNNTVMDTTSMVLDAMGNVFNI